MSDPKRPTGEKIPAYLQGNKAALRESAAKEFRKFHHALGHLVNLAHKTGCYHGQAKVAFTEIVAAQKLLRAIIPTTGLEAME